MENSLLEELLQKYLTGTASENEERQLIEWYKSFNDENVIVPVQVEDEENNIYERLKARIETVLETASLKEDAAVSHSSMRYWFAAAAVVIVLLGSGFWWWNHKNISSLKQIKAVAQSKILPGHNGAILTLADGTKVVLDSSNNGQIGVQGSSKIIKQGSSVVYASAVGITGKTAVEYNTMSTPRGREFQIVLPDGTKVWLNASSSIKYPTTFSDSARLVSITGEAYFEVAHLSDKSGKRIPFVVQTDRMSVKVLGTHFDVNAYSDEQNYKATLFEGSVEVYGNDEHNAVKIVPGQQAQVAENNMQPKVSAADLDKVTAWRNGMFQFDDDRLDNILKQVARWYDVDVDCAEDKQKLRFNGVISRRADVADILHLLSVTGVVNFKISGRKIYAY